MARFGSLPQASATASDVVAWISWGVRDGIAGTSHADRLQREPLRLGKDAVEHLELGKSRQDGRPFRARLGWNERDGPRGGVHPAFRIAGGAPDQPETSVQQTEADAIASFVKRRDRGFEVARGPRRLSDRERSLRSAHFEVHHV